ncbi:MAG: hypothetical protein KZQ94_17920 [Candidatus Thiodiazotropha sp. (ex Troendleina suluensis)]|nr:hypothetical protein [Candidatus Thiodiazotropha sp. (ex Troendleina suluensis)]
MTPTVTPQGKTKPVFSIPLVMDNTGEVADTFFMTGPDGGMRIRQACFVEIHRQSDPIQYVVIAQGRSWDHSPVLIKTTTNDALQASLSLTSKQVIS